MDYEKILKGIVQIINTTEKSDIGFANICTYIGENCPELAESEDERIRKEIRVILLNTDFSRFALDYTFADMLAWLEKQGEKPQGKTVLEAIHEEKVDNANKVEPKFKVGEFVINSYGFTMKVVDIKEESYRYIVIGDNEEKILNCTFRKMEESCHLWDISDAKDGDVLSSINTKSPFIFKKFFDIYHPKCSVSYCRICYDGSFADGVGWWINDNDVCPATKEQRDLLFTKMHEAGYEWDSVKKQLDHYSE